MFRLLSIGIDCFSSILFIIPSIIILQCALYKRHTFSRFIAALIYALYTMAVFSVVGIPAFGTWHVDLRLHLIPLIDFVSSPFAYMEHMILNVILFVPMGFLVPAIWKDFRSLKKMLFMGFAVSLGIEILQIFAIRLTDIDDLITNTAGTIVGYHFSKRFSFQLPFKLSGKNECQYEPIILLFLILMIGIFLKPIVSGGIWDFILSGTW